MGGWKWGGSSWAWAKFKAVRRNSPWGKLGNAPRNTADLGIRIRAGDMLNADGLVNGTGSLTSLLRATLEDRVSGDMTRIDLPLELGGTGVPPGVPVANGAINFRTSVNAILKDSIPTVPGFPGCTSLELVSFILHDENGTPFATSGVFLPDIDDTSPGCTFQHPREAGRDQRIRFGGPNTIPFVQAFVPCGAAGGNVPNSSTETGEPGCQPAETYNEEAGNPPTGWLWGKRGRASMSLRSASNKISGPLNPPNTADVAVHVSLRDIEDANGYASGTGTLSILCRTTFEDRAGGDMTMIDFPVPFPLALVAGAAGITTSFNAILNTSFGSSLPGCTSLEIIDAMILDENGTPFGKAGVLLPDMPNF